MTVGSSLPGETPDARDELAEPAEEFRDRRADGVVHNATFGVGGDFISGWLDKLSFLILNSAIVISVEERDHRSHGSGCDRVSSMTRYSFGATFGALHVIS